MTILRHKFQISKEPLPWNSPTGHFKIPKIIYTGNIINFYEKKTGNMYVLKDYNT